MKHTSNSTFRGHVLPALLLSIVFGVSVTKAQSGSEPVADFGTLLGQGSSAGSQAVMNNSCVPTASAQGLSLLFNVDPTAFTVTPNTYTAVNSLQTLMGTSASGTALNNQMNGIQSYLTTNDPGSGISLSTQISPATPAGWSGAFNAGISVSNAVPSATFLANALNALDGVELTLQWGTVSGGVFSTANGAHEVTLDAINFNAATGTGTISFIDPWGNSTTGNAATNGGFSVVNATLTLLSSGYLAITYPPTLGGGTDPDDNTSSTTLPGSGIPQTGLILDDAVESFNAPDGGSTALMLGAAIVGFAGLSRYRLSRRRA